MLRNITKFGMAFTYPCPRKLRQVMKMSLIEKEPAHKIKEIWKQYHESRVANTADILDKDRYAHIINKANHCPLFIVPLHRGNGHFKLLTQWQDNCFLGTYLEDYKRQGRNAQPYIVFTFFTQLLFSKGLVLVRGDVVNNSMTKSEAMRVWEQLQSSYLEEGKYELVDQFNHRTDQFSMQKYNKAFNID